jgi:hypothetical protein
MGVGIYYFYHRFELKAFEGRHIRMPNEQFSKDFAAITIHILSVSSCSNLK